MVAAWLDFEAYHGYKIPRGTVSAGALNTLGGKICNFRLKSLSISETVRDRPMIAMER